MRSLSAFVHRHPWVAAAEHTLLRLTMFAIGFTLAVLGLALGVTMVMLPVGVVVGLAGVALVVASWMTDLPLPPDA